MLSSVFTSFFSLPFFVFIYMKRPNKIHHQLLHKWVTSYVWTLYSYFTFFFYVSSIQVRCTLTISTYCMTTREREKIISEFLILRQKEFACGLFYWTMSRKSWVKKRTTTKKFCHLIWQLGTSAVNTRTDPLFYILCAFCKWSTFENRKFLKTLSYAWCQVYERMVFIEGNCSEIICVCTQ